MKNSIVIFGRIPEKGKVKSRLAEVLGIDKTLEVYQSLFNHTLRVALEPGFPVIFFYDGELENGDDLPGIVLIKQSGNDFGQKLNYVLKYTFDKLGFGTVVVIGTDCPVLNVSDLMEAFDLLEKNKAVMGRSTDGGYFLLGMNGYQPVLLKDISWSTGKVAKQTLENANKAGISLGLLNRILDDIDTDSDLDNYMSSGGMTTVYREIERALKK